MSIHIEIYIPNCGTPKKASKTPQQTDIIVCWNSFSIFFSPHEIEEPLIRGMSQVRLHLTHK